MSRFEEMDQELRELRKSNARFADENTRLNRELKQSYDANESLLDEIAKLSHERDKAMRQLHAASLREPSKRS